MGIDGLLQVLKPITTKRHISHFVNKTAAIDISCWLYKGAYSCAWQLSQGIRTYDYLHFVINMIKLLKANLITPLFVFDGPVFTLKKETAEKRTQDKQANKKLAEDYLRKGDEEEAKAMFSRCIFISSEMRFTLMDLLDYMKIQYIVAPYEADVQLAYCCAKGFADFVITEDSDILVYGCENVVLKLDHDGNCENITLRKSLSDEAVVKATNDNYIKKMAKLSHEKFVELCILAGCDYLKNIRGIGLKRAMSFINKGSIEEVLEEIDSRPGKKAEIPEGYLEKVKLIKLQFFHGWVIDPRTMKMVTLNPVGEGIEIAGLGEKLDVAIITDYAIGLYDIKKGEKRKRLTKEELIKIILELKENKKEKKVVPIRSEPVISFKEIQFIQGERVEEFNEEIIRVIASRDNLNESGSGKQYKEFLKPLKRKGREIIERGNEDAGGMNIGSEANPSKQKKLPELIAGSKRIQSETNEEVCTIRFKCFKSNEMEEEKKVSPEVAIVNNEPKKNELIIVSDDVSENSMERMDDIIKKGIEKLNEFYAQ